MDPATVAEAIMAIASAIKGMIDAEATARWQKDVSGKLDAIIVQNGLILAMLQQLPLIFEADLKAFFDAEVTIQGKSLCSTFDQYMAGKHPDPQIVSLRTPAELLANNIVQRGPCVYEAANAVALLVIAIHKILHVDRAETAKFIDHVLEFLTKWASNDPGMFGKAIIDTSALVVQARSVLSREPRGTIVLYSERVQYDSGGGPGHGGGQRFRASSSDSNFLGFWTLSVLADVSIDEKNLTYNMTNAYSSEGPNGLRFTEDVVQQKRYVWLVRLEGEMNNTKISLSRLDTLNQHETALKKMISVIQELKLVYKGLA